jgi:hypothetical protein
MLQIVPADERRIEQVVANLLVGGPIAFCGALELG